MISPTEPPQEVIDLLNMVDGGYIGYKKPQVHRVSEEGLTVPFWHPDAEAHDDGAESAFEAYA